MNWKNLQSLLKDEKVLLLDVRTQSEYEEGHIPSAQLVPHTQIAEKLPPVAKDHLIVLYCARGPRANASVNTLSALGYTNIVNFKRIGRWEGTLNTGPNP